MILAAGNVRLNPMEKGEKDLNHNPISVSSSGPLSGLITTNEHLHFPIIQIYIEHEHHFPFYTM